jgi:ParB-like chromosome segregation protein Spo0J
MEIKLVPISKLTPDPENVRTHDAKNLDAISRSLTLFGQRKPIVVARSNSGGLVVIAGNGTLEAAKALGWSEISVTEVPSDWDADRARAYAIADNRTAELADWNKVELSSALLELDAVGYEIADLGFTTAQATSGDTDVPDDFPEFDLDSATSHQCPKCGYEWNGSTK